MGNRVTGSQSKFNHQSPFFWFRINLHSVSVSAAKKSCVRIHITMVARMPLAKTQNAFNSDLGHTQSSQARRFHLVFELAVIAYDSVVSWSCSTNKELLEQSTKLKCRHCCCWCASGFTSRLEHAITLSAIRCWHAGISLIPTIGGDFRRLYRREIAELDNELGYRLSNRAERAGS